MSEKNKPPKRTKGDSNVKNLRNATIMAKAASGKNCQEIGEEVGLSRQAVRKILNSDEVKAIVSECQSRVSGLAHKAMDRVEQMIEDPIDGSNSLKAALAILKSLGLIRESIDLNHSFPKAMVIKRPGGEEVILGTEHDNKKGNK